MIDKQKDQNGPFVLGVRLAIGNLGVFFLVHGINQTLITRCCNGSGAYIGKPHLLSAM